MEIVCTACSQSLTVLPEQIGQSIRCPACQSVLKVQRQGDPATQTTVTCPGCSSKLALPETPTAETFRCPKCSQHLSTRQRSGQQPINIWSDSSAVSGGFFSDGTHGGHGANPPVLGFADEPERSTNKPTTRSSTQWKSKTAYSSKVNSVLPGWLLLVPSLFGLLLNAYQFFYAMGITDAERLSEADVQALKVAMITSSALGAAYLLMIAAGAIQMVIRQRLWAGRSACILAILPITAFTYGINGFCFAAVLYPIALLGGIWGLVVLFGRHTKAAVGR